MTSLHTNLRGSSTLLLLATMLTAQKLPLPDGSGRQLQLFDLHALRAAPETTPALLEPPSKLDPAATPKAAPDQLMLADVFGRLVEPPLGAGDSCQLLGNRWLAVLGSPAQIASAERLFHLAMSQRDRTIEVEIQFLDVGDKDFVGKVRPHLVEVAREHRVSFENVLDAGGAKELAAKLAKIECNRLECPKLTVTPLQRANVSVMNQTAYVRDFNLERQGDTLIADPIVDVVWDGNSTDVCATFLPDGMLGLTCDATFQEVQKPIQTFETTIGLKHPVTIQLPRVTGTRLRQTAVVGAGSLIVLATQKVDGTWLLALVRASAAPR